MDQLPGIFSNAFRSQDPTGALLGVNCDIPVLGFHQDGLAMIIEGIGCGKKLNPTFMQLLGEQTDPCNLRIGKNNGQQMIVVHRLDSFSQGMKSSRLPLADGDVNDLVWTGAIPGRVEMRKARLLELVGPYVTARKKIDPDFVQS